MTVFRVAKCLQSRRGALCPVVLQARRVRSLQQSRCSATSSNLSLSPRGALIVFEGIDRCGKSTQCNLLMDSLSKRGVQAALWRFPDRSTSIGTSINEYLQSNAARDDTVIHLLFTANRFEKRSEMLQLLASGTTLVLDRYSYSGVAYTAAKGVPHLDRSYCRSVEVGLPAADLVVHMDISPEESAARGGYGQERYEKVEFQKKVVEEYEALKDGRWLTVDACLPMDKIHEQVMAALLPVMERVAAGAALGRLWDYAALPLPVPTKA